MRDETIAGFLGELAARRPSPGGGATAALHAAQSAALLAMVARYSDGPRYDAEAMKRAVGRADELREEALRLGEADIAAFGAVGAAYRMPRDTAEQQRARSAAIAAALAGAAVPPAGVIRAAAALAGLAEELLAAGNQNMITDVAAAAAAARAAAVTARAFIEVNLRGIKDPPTAAGFAEPLALTDEVTARADRVVGAVRGKITG
jgi:formiminotetrahydrofolate cyclodeaminase